MFEGSEVGEVLVVGPNIRELFSPLEPVSPLFQHQLDKQQLAIPHVIVVSSGGQTVTGEGI